MTGRQPGHWKSAGVRMTAQEIANARARALTRAQRQQHDDRVAYQYWAAGLLEPWRITMYLNAKGLYGPEVDQACGVEEPAVDLWEAGKLYPTWEQTLALCQLTGVTPMALLAPRPPLIRADQTSMRFHVPAPDLDTDPPLLAFEPAAIAAVVPAGAIKPEGVRRGRTPRRDA